jgi:hypothetical protein
LYYCPTEFLLYLLDVFDSAIAKNLIQKDVEQVVPVILARAGYEMRSIDLREGGEQLLCPGNNSDADAELELRMHLLRFLT